MRKEKQQIQAGVTLSAVQQVKTNFVAQPAVIRHTLFKKKNLKKFMGQDANGLTTP